MAFIVCMWVINGWCLVFCGENDPLVLQESKNRSVTSCQAIPSAVCALYRWIYILSQPYITDMDVTCVYY